MILIFGGLILGISAHYTWSRSVDQLHKSSTQQLAQFASQLEV